MNIQSLSPRSRLLIGLVAGGLMVALLVTIFARQVGSPPPALGDAVAKTTVFSSGSCSQPNVVAAAAAVPVIDPAVAARRVTLLPGEPAVVAKVNGDEISAVQLEMSVSIAVASHQQTLQQIANRPSGSAPVSVPADLHKTPGQLRHDLLDTFIDQRLLLQEGQRLGLVASDADARAMVQQQAQLMQALTPSDPAYLPIQAFLCVNQFTLATFQSSPLAVQNYRDQLTIGTVENRVVAALPADQKKDQIKQQAAVAAHIQQLRQTGKIELFISV